MITIAIPTTPERHTRLKELLDSIALHTKNIEYRVLFYPNNLGGWVPAVHKMLSGIDGYVVLLGSDVIVEEGWLKTLSDKFFERFPEGDGIAEPFNNLHDGTLCQHPFGHVETIKKYLHPGYIHWFSDNEMTERLVKDKKFLYVPEAKIDHRHIVNGKAENDETYNTVFNKETVAKDRALYNKRQSQNYA